MIKKSNHNANFSYSIERLFFKPKIIQNLHRRFDEIFQNKLYLHPHKNVCQISDTDIHNENALNDIKSQLLDFFILITGYKDLKFQKLWLVSTDVNDSSKNELPYIPHFDKERYLKAMVYLHDITIDHGPIHLGKAIETEIIEKRRSNLPYNYKSLGLNTIDSCDLSSELEPMTGSAGDVVFFDTNSPHKAGVVSTGYKRKVIRFDFERKGVNQSSSILRKLLFKIY